MKERIQIVDANDQPLGYATREEAWAQGLHHRLVRILIENERGELLLQKRSMSKKKYPGMWTDAATGHVDYGETYEVAAVRELQEELGVATDLAFLGKFYTEEVLDDKKSNTFHGVFRGKIPASTQLAVAAEEASETKWFTLSELRRAIKESPESFTPGLRQVLQQFVAR